MAGKYDKILGVYRESDSGLLTPSNINDLGDVDTTGAVPGSVLKYDGSDWVVGVDEDTTYVSSDFDHNSLTNTHNLTTDIDHDALTNFVANEHIDWTQSGAGTIHSTNYTNTTYSAGTGITLTGTTFSTNDGQIVHNSLSGVHQDVNTTASPTFVSVLLPFTSLSNLGSSVTINYNSYSNARGLLNSDVTITISNVSNGQRCALNLYYSGAQRTITWSGVKWGQNGEPTSPSSSDEVLVVTFVNDGVNTLGSWDLFDVS